MLCRVVESVLYGFVHTGVAEGTNVETAGRAGRVDLIELQGMVMEPIRLQQECARGSLGYLPQHMRGVEPMVVRRESSAKAYVRPAHVHGARSIQQEVGST
ncbi:hypothetical protein ASF64_09365 [Arthrobacter sp. Leaf137]|nr:hypothetical protein ASF64_09365 [Arthrobacter sp. Leaf137]